MVFCSSLYNTVVFTCIEGTRGDLHIDQHVHHHGAFEIQLPGIVPVLLQFNDWWIYFSQESSYPAVATQEPYIPIAVPDCSHLLNL